MRTNSAFVYILKMPHEHWIYSDIIGTKLSLKIIALSLLSGDSGVTSTIKLFSFAFF